MVMLVLLIVAGVVGLGVVAGFIVLVVRLTDSREQQPYVPHAWQPLPAPTPKPTSAPGWFPDHDDPNALRYFDGQAWTSSTRPRT